MNTKLLAFLLAAASQLASHAVPLLFNVTLDGPSEAPPNASPATGTGLITFDPEGKTMRVQVSFSGLLGTTTAAHIHAPTAAPFTGTASVATQTPTFVGFPLGVHSGTYDSTFDMTLSSSYNTPFFNNNGADDEPAFAALIAAAQAGKAYLNIHSSTIPGGEIRGFLVAAPDGGATLTLMLTGIASLSAAAAFHRNQL